MCVPANIISSLQKLYNIKKEDLLLEVKRIFSYKGSTRDIPRKVQNRKRQPTLPFYVCWADQESAVKTATNNTEKKRWRIRE